MRDEFLTALRKYRPEFGLELDEADEERLFLFFKIVQRENGLLHLVAPGTVDDFVVRHILESLFILRFLPENAKFADVGTGAGLPSIPCLLLRQDLSATLIESKEKKSRYLEAAIAELNIDGRATVIARQFEETTADAGFVTCRALDKFTKKLPRLLKWANGRTMLLYGGENLQTELQKNKVDFEQVLLPLSERRFLFHFKN